MSICEVVGNNVWTVVLHGGSKRTVVGKNHIIDGHGNLVFSAFLPCDCLMTTATFAAGSWTDVTLARPVLVAFDGILGS